MPLEQAYDEILDTGGAEPTVAEQQAAAWAAAQRDPALMAALAAQGITSAEQLPYSSTGYSTASPLAIWDDPATRFNTGVQFLTNKGGNAMVGGESGLSGFVQYAPNGQYRLVDNRTGETLYTGTGNTGLDEVFRLSQELSKTQGSNADWDVQVFNPAINDWSTRAHDDPANKTLGAIADIGLPLLGAALMPLTGGASAALLAGLGGALGSGVSSALQGRDLEDALLRAAISGAGAGVGTSVLGGATGPLSSVFGTGAGDAAAQAAAAAAGDIIVTAPSAAVGAVAGGLGGGIGSLGGQLASNAIGSAPNPNDIIVTAPLPGGVSPIDAAIGAGGIAAGAGVGALPNETYTPDITVTGQQPTQPPAGGGALGAATGAINTSPPTADNASEILVERTIPPQDQTTIPPPVFPPNTTIGNPATSQEIADATTPDEAGEGGNTLNDIANYLRLAGLITGLGGSALGGGKKNLMPGGGFGSGALNPIFHAQLPTGNVPGTGGGALGPRVMPAQDWNLYGTRPEQSFYQYVPQTYNPPEPNKYDQWPYMSRGYAEGGPVSPLDMATGGRADDVPAMLSDGEYVIDAETVALLGNGSLDEGARKLDSLRVNVRRHKGRQLAKGKISPNARPAERYLGAR